MRTPWVRLVLAISLDGRIALPNGGIAKLGSKCDRRVLEEALAWSDGTLMGGGTLRAHRSTCLIHDRDLIKQRLLTGRSQQPVSLIVSSQNLPPPDWPFFKQPIQRWLLVPPNMPSQTSSKNGYECVIQMNSQWSETLAELKTKGLSRLILLGGAHLAASLFQADQIDELQLTLSPRIIGGEKTWIPAGANSLPIELRDAQAWQLAQSEQLDNNELILRYFRNRSQESSKSSMKLSNN